MRASRGLAGARFRRRREGFREKGEPGLHSRRGVLFEQAFLYRLIHDAQRGIQQLLNGVGVLIGKSFFELLDLASHPAPIAAIDLGLPRRLTDALDRGTRICHENPFEEVVRCTC